MIPQAFGGGCIKDYYYDCGRVFEGTDHEADLYGILAYWNHCPGMKYDGEEYPTTMQDILEHGNTCLPEKRMKGLSLYAGCSQEKIAALEYPLKLVSARYKEAYEECAGISYTDLAQGLKRTYRS